MSWTKFTCLFSFCALLAAPVMAQPPLSVDLVRNGSGNPILDSNGGFVWTIGVDPDETQFDTPADGENAGVNGAATALDVGFDLAGGLSANSASRTVANFDTNTPGNSTFGDETADGDGDFIGVQIGSDASNVFASLGSVYFTDGAVKEALRITTAPLTTNGLTTSVAWGGAYDAAGAAGNTHGAVAQGGSYDSQIGVQGWLPTLRSLAMRTSMVSPTSATSRFCRTTSIILAPGRRATLMAMQPPTLVTSPSFRITSTSARSFIGGRSHLGCPSLSSVVLALGALVACGAIARRSM